MELLVRELCSSWVAICTVSPAMLADTEDFGLTLAVERLTSPCVGTTVVTGWRLSDCITTRKLYIHLKHDYSFPCEYCAAPDMVAMPT